MGQHRTNAGGKHRTGRSAGHHLTAAVAVGVLAAAGTSAIDGTQLTPAAKPAHQVAQETAMPALAAVVTPNSLYAATGAPPVVVLGPSGSLVLPAGYVVAPVATGSGGVSAVTPTGGSRGSSAAANPTLSFSPAMLARSTSSPSDGGAGPILAGSGPAAFASSASFPLATPDAASSPTGFGLFSPTGAFLGLIGPGGVLIGDGVLPGQNGGVLLGNGAPGAEGQRGGNAGLIGNGGDGGDAFGGQPLSLIHI